MQTGHDVSTGVSAAAGRQPGTRVIRRADTTACAGLDAATGHEGNEQPDHPALRATLLFKEVRPAF